MRIVSRIGVAACVTACAYNDPLLLHIPLLCHEYRADDECPWDPIPIEFEGRIGHRTAILQRTPCPGETNSVPQVQIRQNGLVAVCDGLIVGWFSGAEQAHRNPIDQSLIICTRRSISQIQELRVLSDGSYTYSPDCLGDVHCTYYFPENGCGDEE